MTAPTVPLPGRKATLGGIVIFFMAYFIYRVYGNGVDLTINHWITIWGCIGIMLLTFMLYTWVNYKQGQILPVEMSFDGQEIANMIADSKLGLDNLRAFAEGIDQKADMALAKGEKE